MSFQVCKPSTQSLSGRIASVLLSLSFLATVDCWIVLAAPHPERTSHLENEPSDALRLVPHRRAKKSLEAAEDLIAQKEWAEATRILQTLLDMKEDAFIQVQRRQAHGEEATQWTSVRAEVHRLLGRLPHEGLEVYELAYGARARSLLQEARQNGDPRLLAEVTQRFLYTKAGADAAELLGTYHLDRGRPVMAALCFERLLNNRFAEIAQPMMLLKAALALRYSGDKVQAGKAWQRLYDLFPRGVEIGGRTVALKDLEQQVGQVLFAAPENTGDWTMFQGNPCRSGRSHGDAPFLDEETDSWTQPTCQRQESRQWLSQAITYQEHRQQGVVLPAGFPIAVRDLLVYRSHGGIVAVDGASGKLRWEARSEWSLDGMIADATKSTALNQWVTMYLESGNPAMLYENSTLGTLSTDQRLVFAVDDLAVPPHPSLTHQNETVHRGLLSHALGDRVRSNRLLALELDTGKLRWQIGGSSARPELGDCFFLGPPLPLGGKLYVLIEKNSELRLACLEAANGMVHWSQTLATVRDRLSLDAGRRLHGIQLAYADGVLVCPTNAGVIMGIDLLTHSLIWAKPYRESIPTAILDPDINRRRLHAARHGQRYRPDWKDSAPIVLDGKVIFTAPDGVSIHCLNLRDGATLWQADRDDDLYLGGVYEGLAVLVGRYRCRALRIDDGTQAWSCATGLPSGMGVAGDGIYYLPLRRSIQDHGAEVCSIEIATGHILGHARTRHKEAPGNLLFCAGKVISQTVQEVTAYPQLQTKLAQIEQRLREQPNDPELLLARAELRLSKGEPAGAAADLHAAIDMKPRDEVLAKLRPRLFEALTELLQHDFRAGENYLAEYRALCEAELATGPNANEHRLQRRQQFFRLLAQGRERQGRLAEALEAYLECSLNPRSTIRNPQSIARSDVWTRGRIAAVVAGATSEHRQALDAAMMKRWQSLASTEDLDALRRFVALFDASLPVGQEARLRLAELLAKSEEHHDFLEAELALLQVQRAGEGTRAAQAIEQLAHLLENHLLHDDAVYWYEVLGRDYTRTPVRSGKTGADIYQHVARDPEWSRYLTLRRSPWDEGSLHARSKGGDARPARMLLHLSPRGEVLPFFRNLDIALETNRFQLKLIDRTRGLERSSQPLVRSPVYFNLLSTQLPRCAYHSAGHIVIVQVGHMVYAYDAHGAKLLWEKNLLGTTAATYHILPDADGGFRAFFADGRVQTLGRVGPVEASFVCLQTHEGLVALDPLSGEVLWTRSDLAGQAEVFGDSRRIYHVRIGDNGAAEAALALCASDGSTLATPEVPAGFNHKHQICGDKLLLNEIDASGVTLRLLDLAGGRDTWKQRFSSGARVLETVDPNLAGAVEPDGKLSVFDLRTRQALLSGRVEPGDLEKVDRVYALSDAERFYVVMHAPVARTANLARGPLLGLAGVSAVEVNGAIYAFERGTGRLCWRIHVPHQLLIQKDFADLPVLLCVARLIKLPGATVRQATIVQSFDKRTGRPVFEREYPNAAQFHSLHVHIPERRAELLGFSARIEYHMESGEIH